MKQIVILFSFAFIFNTINAQIELSTSLVDSLVAKLYTFEESSDIDVYRPILNFTSLIGQRNSLYVSSTSIKLKNDIHENMMIYIYEKEVFFVILRDVEVNSCFRSRLIEYNDPRFEKTLDSIKFGKGPFHGLVLLHAPLTVYRIRKRPLCKNTYAITSKKYIPYLSAPEKFIPLSKFANIGALDEIFGWYYDAFGNLNKQYYEDLKPEKKIILRMPKEKEHKLD